MGKKGSKKTYKQSAAYLKKALRRSEDTLSLSQYNDGTNAQKEAKGKC